MRISLFRPPKFFGLRKGPWEGLEDSRLNSSLQRLVLEVFESKEKEEEEDMLK